MEMWSNSKKHRPNQRLQAVGHQWASIQRKKFSDYGRHSIDFGYDISKYT